MFDAEQLREQFSVTRNYNYQNHAGVAPVSQRVAKAMRSYVDRMLEFGPVKQEFYRHAEKVRKSAATLINSAPDEIAFIKNTTEGIGWVAGGLNWSTGDNVVTTNVEFPANVYPWMGLQSRGVQLKMVPEDSGRVPVDRIVEAIDSKTRVVAVSAVQYASGFRLDLAELGRICQERGVLFCVDAIQALGVFPIDVRAMHIDFLAADGHKWLCGPEGCGVFYINRELLGNLKPLISGWLGMKNALDYGNYQYEFVDNARRFDTGSYNLAGIFGLGAAIDLALETGIDRISSHVLMLTDRLVRGVLDKGYRIVSSRRPGEASGIVSMISDLHDLDQLRNHLEAEYRIVTAFREKRLRVSPHVYNTPQEIDQLVEVLPAH